MTSRDKCSLKKDDSYAILLLFDCREIITEMCTVLSTFLLTIQFPPVQLESKIASYLNERI